MAYSCQGVARSSWEATRSTLPRVREDTREGCGCPTDLPCRIGLVPPTLPYSRSLEITTGTTGSQFSWRFSAARSRRPLATGERDSGAATSLPNSRNSVGCGVSTSRSPTTWTNPKPRYFVAIADGMPQGADIILCSAAPGWYAAEEKADSYRILSYAAWIAENAGKSLRVPLVLSGDSHHYCRYSGASGTQFITSGGGGAFLHGTHQLKDEIRADWLREHEAVLSLKTEPTGEHAPTDHRACYPSQEQSWRLITGNFAFPVLNWDFSLLLAFVYLLAAFTLTEAPRVDLATGIYLTLAAIFCGYAGYQEGWTAKVLSISLLHALAHFAAIVCLAWLAATLDSRLFGLYDGPWWLWLVALTVIIYRLGWPSPDLFSARTLYLTCRFANMSHNDAFSAIRLDSHRHFLRIRITDESIAVYPIGVEEVPQRQDWREVAGLDRTSSELAPRSPLRTRLIEGPVVIAVRQAASTPDVKMPAASPPKQDR